MEVERRWMQYEIWGSLGLVAWAFWYVVGFEEKQRFDSSGES